MIGGVADFHWRSVLAGLAAMAAMAPAGPAAIESGATAEVKRLSPLAAEDSPHLRQYLDSPIHWRPWGPEAFAEADRQNKPLFVSIGYFSCHWCALMERGAFRDPAVVRQLNEQCISVKVDRFERPDLDRLYLRYFEDKKQNTGWPLNVWMTPDRLPVRGVTYLPATDEGQGDFSTVATYFLSHWARESAHLRRQARVDLDRFGEKSGRLRRPDLAVQPELLDMAFGQIMSGLDPVNGGFGRVPKFPAPTRLEFLGRYAGRQSAGSTRSVECRDAIEVTLAGMSRGGLRDHLGGGFFRYTFDEAWKRPYFEKMAFDQAMMIESYLTGYQLTKRPEFAEVVRETVAYVDRELSHPEGGFCNAEHCESLPAPGASEPMEGAYYLWRREDLDRVAGTAAGLLEQVFDVRDAGNIPPGSDPFNRLAGRNLLAAVHPPAVVATRLGLTPQQATDDFERGRAALLAERNTRPRPARDGLLITQMNGALIAALTRAAMVLDEPDYLVRAVRCATFMRRTLWQETSQTLHRSCTDRPSKVPACADDYACLIGGVLNLYEATGEIDWLQWAEALQRAFDTHHGDAADGGYFDARHGLADVPMALKSDDDASGISGNAVAGLNLVRWSSLLDHPDRLTDARRLLSAFGAHLENSPGAVSGLALVADGVVHPPGRVVIIGDPAAPLCAEARRAVWAQPSRGWSVLQLDAGPGRVWLSARTALPAAVLAAPAASPAVYVLEGASIKAGPLSPGELNKLLRGER